MNRGSSKIHNSTFNPQKSTTLLTIHNPKTTFSTLSGWITKPSIDSLVDLNLRAIHLVRTQNFPKY